MKIAYLIANFPALSETFVSNEVARLKALGENISVYAFGRTPVEDREKLTDTAKALANQTRYIGKREAIQCGIKHPSQLVSQWSANREMQTVSSGKPQPQMRLFRANCLARLLERDGIDHLHAHWPYATEVAWLAHRMTGIPFSVSIHAHEVAHENGHFPLVFPDISFATFCNRGAMEHLLGQLGEDARSRCHLVYHGVDISNFTPLDLPSDTDPLRVVSAGRLTATKGFDRLIRACAIARQQGTNVSLAILGRGGEEKHLRAVAESCEFSSYLELPGWVSHSTVRNFLADSHVFALLADTGFHDGLPNVVLEAMASGRPVVLSPLPAAGEAVDNGIEGFIVGSPDDLNGTASALASLANSPESIHRMGQAARKRVVADHDADHQIIRLQKLFHG